MNREEVEEVFLVVEIEVVSVEETEEVEAVASEVAVGSEVDFNKDLQPKLLKLLLFHMHVKVT